MSGIRRVVAGVSGSPGSLQALRYAAGLARLHDVTLVPVLAWLPPGGELANGRPYPYLQQIWRDGAWQRLWQAVDLALGGVPVDLRLEPQVLRGQAGAALTATASSDGDVLVLGAGRRGALRRLTACRVGWYCLAHARCPVIAVPPADLARLSRGIRGWALRHRGPAQNDPRLRVSG